jgi:hypothetical protein
MVDAPHAACAEFSQLAASEKVTAEHRCYCPSLVTAHQSPPVAARVSTVASVCLSMSACPIVLASPACDHCCRRLAVRVRLSDPLPAYLIVAKVSTCLIPPACSL